MEKITIAIITKNEEEVIRQCLETVKWADEIIVVDAYSSDKTVQICREYTNKVFQNEFADFSAQKNLALSKAGNDWILFIDADEKISPQLKEEISLLEPHGRAGYYIPRKNIIFGKHFRYGGHQNDLQLRLFRKSKSHFENPIHEKAAVNGKTGLLRNALEHYSTRSLSEYVEKLNLYTDLEAKFMMTQGRTIRKRDFIIKPAGQFLLRYLFKGGYKDGLEGLIFYSLSSFYTFIKYAKFWELSKKTV
jgi:glycosyltransferase involved in cell wall biosynthesis